MKPVTNWWRRLPVKVRAQAARFIRVFAITVGPALLVGLRTDHLTWTLVASTVTAAAETAFRQVVSPAETKPLLRELSRVSLKADGPATSNPAVAKPGV